VLRAGGAAVAASYCIEHARDVYQLKTGYDAAHGKASPGQVLHMRVLQALWAAGEARSFDFASRTTEHGGYKERWANDSRGYAVVRLFRPRRLRGQMLAQVVRLKHALAARAYL
jgi:CelD/BcsL family acetyltransferase involved in cellulose biosynthesis